MAPARRPGRPHRAFSPVGSQHGVVIIACLRLRVGVHERRAQARQRMQQAVLGVDSDPVGLDRAGTGVDDDLAFSAQPVPDPPQPDLAHAEHPRRAAQGLFHLVNQGRVDGIHQPAVDLPDGLAQHREDGHRDHQADHRVGPGPAHRHATHAQQHRQRRKPVGAGVQPISDQRGRADLPADPDPVPGDQFVAGETDDRGGRHRDQVGHRPRMHQPGHRLVRSQAR